jgi:uncharacterized protein (DUF58 family)
MTRVAYSFYRLVSTLRYATARRLTPAGWIALTALVLTGGMATDTEQSLGYQAFTLVAAMWIVAVALAPFFRVKFSAQRALPKFGSAGQPVRYRVSIRNLTARTQAGLSVLDKLVDPRPSLEEFAAMTRPSKRRRSFTLSKPVDTRRVLALKPAPLPSLPPRGAADVELELFPVRRGVLHFAAVSLARTDPFLLFRAFSSAPLRATITILPKRYRLPQIALPGTSQYQQGGVAFAAAIGESEEFVALRDYRAGDPLRRIHWKSWAKAGRPIVKEFQDEFFVRHALVLDTFTDADEVELFEEAVSVAASFASTIDTQESLLDLLFIGPQAFTFTIGRGVAHAEQMLEILASVRPSPHRQFAALEQLVVEHAAAVSGCICIFLAWDEARRRLVRKLSKMSVPVLVLFVRERGARPFERSPDDPESLHGLEVGNLEAGLALIG